MNHIMIGASIPFILGTLWYLSHGCRMSVKGLIGVPALMAVCGLWAIVPDIPRMLGFKDLYHTLAATPKIDLFFWHYQIDQIESDTPLYAVGYVLMAAFVLFAIWREIQKEEAA